MTSYTKALKDVIILGLKNRSPIRTGNLRYNSIKVRVYSEREVHIYVDQNIAPYMVFTNEKWISPKWHGRQNPNEAWFDKASESVAQDVLRKFRNLTLLR